MNRRGFLFGLIAAPVVIKIPQLLMPIKPVGIIAAEPLLLTINQITREAVRLFKNSNKFIKDLDQYEDFFLNAAINDKLRIRLPNEYWIEA